MGLYAVRFIKDPGPKNQILNNEIKLVVQRNPACHINPTYKAGKHFRFDQIKITPEPNDFASKKKRLPGFCRIAVKEENR